MSETKVPFESWGVVELFGHRRLGGLLSEATLFGGSFLRIDIPAPGPVGGKEFVATQYYGDKAVFSLTTTSEEAARLVAAGNQPAPVHVWELPAPAKPVRPANPFDPDDDEEPDERDGHDHDYYPDESKGCP